MGKRKIKISSAFKEPCWARLTGAPYPCVLCRKEIRPLSQRCLIVPTSSRRAEAYCRDCWESERSIRDHYPPPDQK
jgi:hypothetical protein